MIVLFFIENIQLLSATQNIVQPLNASGVTLPFLSYGGSSLLITLCSIGIVLNISRHNKC